MSTNTSHPHTKHTQKNFQPKTFDSALSELLLWHFHYFPFLSLFFLLLGFQSCWWTGQVVQLLLGQRVCSLGCAGFATNFMDSASITKKSQFTLGYCKKSPRLSEALFNTWVYAQCQEERLNPFSSLNWRRSCSLLPWLQVFSGRLHITCSAPFEIWRCEKDPSDLSHELSLDLVSISATSCGLERRSEQDAARLHKRLREDPHVVSFFFFFDLSALWALVSDW